MRLKSLTFHDRNGKAAGLKPREYGQVYAICSLPARVEHVPGTDAPALLPGTLEFGNGMGDTDPRLGSG